MYCVIFLKNGKEHQTPWFASKERARRALDLMKRRYGERNAVLYLD